MNRQKYTLIGLLWLIAAGLAACAAEEEAALKAWIDFPRAGSTFAPGEVITIVSHAYAREGLAEIVLFVNGEAYQRNAPAETGADFSEFRQDWAPAEPGVYTLQIRAYDQTGAASPPDSVSVQVEKVGAETAPEIPPTASFTPVISPSPTPTPVISITPTLTFTSHPPTPTLTFTPHSPTPTFTFTPIPSDTTPPPVPTPMVPANGLEVSCRATQTLAWLPVDDPSGIEGYSVELEREVTKGQWQNVNEWGSIGGKQIDVPVDCGIRYRWIVRARDGAGNFSDWSPIFYFSVNLD